MFEIELNKLYTEIAQTVTNIIPVDWSDFYLHAEVSKEKSNVFFFFNIPSNKKIYIYSHDIPNLYGVGKEEYNKDCYVLLNLIIKLQKVFTDNNQEPWFAMNFMINEEMSLKIKYDYVDWGKSEFSSFDRITYFQHKYLNKVPESIEEKDLFTRMEDYEKIAN